MNFTNWLKRLTGIRTVHVKTPDDNLPTESPVAAHTAEGAFRGIITRYSTDIFGRPDEEQAFERGHIDGAFDGDEGSFIAFIQHRVSLHELEDQVGVVSRERDEAAAQLAEVKQMHLALSEAEAQREVKERRAREAREAHDESRKELAKVREEEVNSRGKGSLLHAIPYLVAGIAFFLGDLIVSYEVVAQALKLGNSENDILVLVERWTFALGIASLTFLIKPAYERLVEEPYWNGRKRLFNWIILIMALFTVGTLGLLGGLRAEFVQALQEADTAGRQITFSFDETPTTGESASDGAISDTVSGLQVAAFVLTSVLFAVAGAICFGMATMYWRRFFDERRPVIRRIRGTRRWRLPSLPAETNRLLDELKEAERDLATGQALIQSLKNRIEDLGPAEKLRQRIQDLDLQLVTLAGAVREQNREALIASYRSGYQLARHNVPAPGDLHTGVSAQGDDRHGRSPFGPASGDGARSGFQPGAVSPVRREPNKRPRPFLWVRREIMRKARVHHQIDR